MAKEVDVQYRIGATLGLLFGVFALFLDGAEILLDLGGTAIGGVGVAIGYLKDFAVLVLLPLGFTIVGAPFWKGRKAKKKMITMISAFLISLVPWLGAAMPETFVGVVATIYLTRKEDYENAQEQAQGALKSNITRAKRVVQKVRRVRN